MGIAQVLDFIKGPKRLETFLDGGVLLSIVKVSVTNRITLLYDQNSAICGRSPSNMFLAGMQSPERIFLERSLVNAFTHGQADSTPEGYEICPFNKMCSALLADTTELILSKIWCEEDRTFREDELRPFGVTVNDDSGSIDAGCRRMPLETAILSAGEDSSITEIVKNAISEQQSSPCDKGFVIPDDRVAMYALGNEAEKAAAIMETYVAMLFQKSTATTLQRIVDWTAFINKNADVQTHPARQIILQAIDDLTEKLMKEDSGYAWNSHLKKNFHVITATRSNEIYCSMQEFKNFCIKSGVFDYIRGEVVPYDDILKVTCGRRILYKAQKEAS